ncbi:serine/threonine-protein kinase [Kitasatospora sp. NBC_01266]|uniref:serine/threonine-protein kinase n=1 Tax=Kitasatospora sp. NBC_01266 TaxID=2903572 RepID=UPI002E35A7D9|nr:serine/threonine-protein kinase [Kitasatospora sp. NBC_01266]
MNTGGPETRLIDGRFELLQRLGGGGMGLVWRARDTALHREVALKEVRPADPAMAAADPALTRETRERVLREARALARLQHPNVAVIHHIVDGAEYEHPWLVMELVTGGSLADRLTQGPLSVPEAVRIGRGVLSALSAAHAVGIQHRDVKPGNVLLRPDGTPVLTDFGIAAMSGATALTSTGALIGSPEFMAPERIRGEEGNPSSDLWSLGMMLYVAVEGHHPLRRGTVIATLAAMLDEPLPPAQHAGSLGPLLDTLLAKDPAARPNAAQLDRALAQAEYEVRYGGGSVQPTPTVVATPAATPTPTMVAAPTPAPAAAVDRPLRTPAQLYQRRWRTGLTTLFVVMITGVSLYSFMMRPGRFNTASPSVNATVTAPAGTSTGSAAGTGAGAAAPAASAAPPDLTTPAGVRATIATMRSTMGGTQVYELDIHQTSADARVPAAGSSTEYDNVDYDNNQTTRRTGSDVTPIDKLVDLQDFNWDALPALWQKAQDTLKVTNPTDHYLIIGPDLMDGTPCIRLYISNAYDAGYLVADEKGNVTKSYPLGS